MINLFIFLGVVCITVSLFLNLYPLFGGNPSKEQKEVYKKTNNYVNGKFVNQVPTKRNMSAADIFSMIKDSISGGKDRSPVRNIPLSQIEWNKIKNEEDSLTWFGHSAFLLSIDNNKILVDPMLGSIASPVSANAIVQMCWTLLMKCRLLMLSLLHMIITIT